MSSDYEFEDDEPYVVIERHEGGVGSFLFGLALGAGVALLLAPRAGADTRRDLSLQARRARDRAQELAGDVGETVADSFTQARDQVETRIEATRQAIDMKRQQVARAMEAGRAAAQQARDDLERRIADTKAAYQAGTDAARAALVAPTPPSSSAVAGEIPKGTDVGASGPTAAGGGTAGTPGSAL
jgi:gas vesicle protein